MVGGPGLDDFEASEFADSYVKVVFVHPDVPRPFPRDPDGRVAVDLLHDDPRAAVEESKAGKVEYRTDRTAIVHLVIGKRSFEERALLENYAAVIEELIRAKPSAAKGRYLRTVTLAPTMGPGVKVDPTRTRDILGEEAAATAAA